MDILRKVMLASVGLAYMTKEKIEDLGKKIAAETNVPVDEGRAFVEELVSKTERARKGMESAVQNTVKKVIASMNLATKEQMTKLEKRLADLESKLEG